MKKYFKKSYIALPALLMVSAFISGGCGKKEEPGKSLEKNQIVAVRTIKAVKGEITTTRTFAGTLEGTEQSSIVARISERITGINAGINDYVKKGQIVFLLDKTGPTSVYLQTKANLDNLEKEVARMQALYNEGAISQQALDQVKTGYEVAKANFEAARSTVELASPIGGMLTTLNVNTGDWVTPGKELAIVANISQMIIKFTVNETEIGKVKTGGRVKIEPEFDKEYATEGSIYEISRAASSDSRSFTVKARFPNVKDSWYKPGMFINAGLVLDSKKDILTIPAAAVVYAENKKTVFVIRDGKAYKTEVETGISDDNSIEILSGLKEGDEVVVTGMNNLKENSKVTVLE